MLSNSSDLIKSYDSRFQQFCELDSLTKSDIKSSLDLFEPLVASTYPIPKKLDVIAVISGRPFDQTVIQAISPIKKCISHILKETPHYLVKDKNLAVEYCVLKWHYSTYSKSLDPLNEMNNISFFPKIFHLDFHGIQVHQDGSIILRTIDPKLEIRTFRKNIVEKFKGFPAKQSQWAHIPLGRILAPLTNVMKSELQSYCFELNKNPPIDQLLVDTISLVHEHQWYMENVTYLWHHSLRE
ncbi:hypothetical protein N8563_00680 [bacterium]|nr:hypothetical protein [bacterium]